MVKRKVKKTALKNTACADEDTHAEKEPKSFQDPEVKRWSDATRASRDLEIDNLLTSLHLLRSYFTEEQLQTGVLQFFKENLPNLAIVKNGENGYIEVERKDKVGNSSMNQDYGFENTNADLLHQRSSLAGLELITLAVKANAHCADNLQINDFMLGEPSESQLFGLQDTLRTPGVNSQRLSIGTIGKTPNTVRLPKHGEMLLSVRGSPLGVYNQQDNMEPINESEEG